MTFYAPLRGDSVTLYPTVAHIISQAERPLSLWDIGAEMDLPRKHVKYLLDRMREAGFVDMRPAVGRSGIRGHWQLTSSGTALLSGYVPSTGDAGDTRKLNAVPLLEALGIPRIAPSPPLSATVHKVIVK